MADELPAAAGEGEGAQGWAATRRPQAPGAPSAIGAPGAIGAPSAIGAPGAIGAPSAIGAPTAIKAFEGAVLGLVGGPAAGFGAAWSGIGDVRLHTWFFVTIFSALIGFAAWPVFADASGPPGRRGIGFAALFAATAGLLGGTLAAFPFGAVTGVAGGAVGGAVAAALWRLGPRLGRATAPVAAAVGALAALGAVALALR